MFEETKSKRLAAVEQYAPAILKEFSGLLNARAMILAYDEKNFRFLSIEKIDSYTIDANYHGATVRFQLFLTYKGSSAIGRVICLHKYRIVEKIHFNVLGEFTFDHTGLSDLPQHENGGFRTLTDSADEIVTAFLDQAIEFGPGKFVAQ